MSERNGTINMPDGNQIAINVLDNPHGAIISLHGRLGVVTDFTGGDIDFGVNRHDENGIFYFGVLIDEEHLETARFISAMRDNYVDNGFEKFDLRAIAGKDDQQNTLIINVHSHRKFTELGESVAYISRQYAKHAWELAYVIYQHQAEN